MSKSFAFVLFLLGALIAQVVCPRPPSDTKNESTPEPEQREMAEGNSGAEADDKMDSTNKSDEDHVEAAKKETGEERDDDDDDDQEEEEEEDEEEAESPLPVLTCVLFEDDSACNTMCSMVSAIYGDPFESGTCGEAGQCQCNVSPNATLHELWNAKFNSYRTLQEIRRDSQMSEKIFDLLKTPMKRPQQAIKELKAFLTPRQMGTLRLRDPLAHALLQEKGKFDKPAIRTYVSGQLKSAKKPLRVGDYKKTLVEALDAADEDTFDHILSIIRRSQNKTLNGIVDEYVKENQITDLRPQSYHAESLIEELDTAIINQVIKPLRRANSSNRGKFASREQRSQRTAKSTEVAPKKSPNDKPISSDAPWILPGFDKTKELARPSEDGTRCWDTADYNVCFTEKVGLTKLDWNNEKSDFSVQITYKDNGDVIQLWKYGINRVQLMRQYRNSIPHQQTWNFGHSYIFEKNIYKDGSVIEQWEDAENPEALKNFKHIIDSWCENNDFFIPNDKCIIY